jgi:hypothetical protein
MSLGSYTVQRVQTECHDKPWLLCCQHSAGDCALCQQQLHITKQLQTAEHVAVVCRTAGEPHTWLLLFTPALSPLAFM